MAGIKDVAAKAGVSISTVSYVVSGKRKIGDETRVRAAALELGYRPVIGAIKTDFGERIPRDVVWHDGAPKLSMHNWYTELYNQTVFEVIEEVYGAGKACLFARSATSAVSSRCSSSA